MATGLDAQQKIFATNPDDRRAFEALEEHFFLEGDWDSLVRLYRDRIAAPSVTEDEALLVPLLFRLGQILEERVLDLDEATEVFWALARLDPTNRPALRQLRGIHERRGQWDMVLQIAELESATTMPPYERAAFEAELGRTWQQQLGDPDEAKACFERALESDAEFPTALEGLAQLHQEAERWADAASILERLTDRLRGPERAPVWIALGTLYAGPLETPDRARQCFAAALEDDPFQAPAVEWSLLLATADEDWPVVSELLESRFDLASGARHRAAIAVEASQIQLNHLDSPARARAWIDRALDLCADETSVLLAAGDVERRDGDRDALLQTLDRLITLTGERAPRNALVEAAELHSDFGNPDAALDAIRRAAARSGEGDERILTLQARLLRQGGSKRELSEVLEILTALDVPTGDSAPRAEQLRELAGLQEDDLGDEAAALGSWRRAFDLEPDSREALDALERIYRKQDDWDALREVLTTASDACRNDLPASLPARLGALLLDHFDEADRARTLFEEALALDSSCPPALEGLRQLADQSGDPDLLLDVCEREAAGCHEADKMGDLARTAISILEGRSAIEDALGWAMRWSRLAPSAREAFELRADFEARLGRSEREIESRRALARLQTGPERAATLERQAKLHLNAGQESEAAAALELALESNPESIETLDALCNVYRRLDRAQDLVRTLRVLADLLPEDEQADALEELATTLQDPLGDLDTAIVVRWRLVELPDGPAEASGKLETLLDMAGRYSELAHLCQMQRQRVGDESPEAFALDMRRAKILLDSLGHCDEAAEIFSALHERHPESEEILDLLERALRTGDDAAGLCDLLERRAGWESDDERRAELQIERAMLMEESLGERLPACDLYEKVLTDHPGSEAAKVAEHRFETLLETTSQWDRLRDRLSARAEALPAEEQATLREQLATLCRDRLHDIAGCAEQLEIIAQVTTDRVHVWQQLEEIYAQELDRPADWLRVVKAELACEPSAEREFMLRVGAARLCLDDERRPEGREAGEAYEHYERVLELDPGHAEAAEVLALHFANEGRHDETARILEQRLESVTHEGGAEATDLRMRLAKLLSERLADDERARPLYEDARAALGAVPQVSEPLAELYERTGDHAALSELSRAVLESQEGSDAGFGELQWRVRLASSEHALGHLDEAAVAYRAALVASPDDRQIEDALIEIYGHIEEVEPLTQLLEKRLPYAREDEAIDLRLRLAHLHAERRNDPREALEHLEQILDVHPQHRDAFDRAIELADRTGDSERLLSLLDRSLATSLPDAERADLLERRAHLLADELDRPEQAVLAFREAIAFDRGRASARLGLRTQLERLERWPAFLDCLFVEAMGSEPARRVELFEEAAEIAWSRVGPDASLPWLARLLQERPEDPELFARLAEVHRRAGRFEAALRALDEELERRSEPSERCDLYLQSARLLERELHAPARAIHAYREALRLSSNPAEVLAELDRLYDLMGRPSERTEILEARIEHVEGEELIELRRTLATIFCADLAKPERAIPHLVANVEALRHEPADEMAALGALDAALRASGRHDAWVGVAERELELIENDADLAEATPPEFKRYLHAELARTYDRLMGDSERALAHLRILCAGGDESGTDLGERLRALLRRTGRQSELAAELTALVESEGAPPSAWLELGQLREEVLLDLAGAREAYDHAQADNDHRLEALRGLRRCSERARDWQGVADALAGEFALADRLGRTERTRLARCLGDIYWQRLGAAEGAAEAYQLALDLDAKDLDALRSLIVVKEACQEAGAAVALYRRELEILGDRADTKARRREAWLRIACLSSEECDQPDQAIEAYRAAAKLERLSAPDELLLARLFETTGDAEAFCDTLGSWCDREDSDAAVRDHLELARALVGDQDAPAARARAERATAVAPESSEAWALLAELEREAENFQTSASAFERAAEHSGPEEAASYCVEAAACLEDLDLDEAHRLLERATELDPGSLSGHVAFVRVADRLERPEETLREAERALDLARAETLDDPTRLEIAVLGGRAARGLGDRDASRELYETALEIERDHTEALEGVGRAYFEDGDYSAARAPLERRLELPGEDPDRALHLSIVARGLEADEHLDAAWARYEEAIELDHALEDAHEGVVRVHERAARPDEALRALERWSQASRDRKTRALSAFRAGEHALALEDPDHAIRLLEDATDADPELAPAWVLLCELAGGRGPDSDVRTLCSRALDAIEPGPQAAQISLRAARLAEVAGETDEARALYAKTVGWDSRMSEASLCESRLARMAGDWPEADAVLSRFIEGHPDPESPSLAHVYLERGRLLSGPLEQFDQAVSAYESALALQPDLGVARTSLAGLLLHAPERWVDALALHKEILSAQPTSANSLRAVRQLAEQRGQSDIAGGALAVLRALGIASPQEEAEAPSSFRFPIHPGPPMAEPEGERLRRLAHQVSEELAGVLGGLEFEPPTSEDEEITETIGQIMSLEDELSAPGVARLDPEERGALFSALVALFLDPGGNGQESRFRAGLEEALGRWTRRKVRRIAEETSIAEIEAMDHQAWGEELRAMAAAQFVDRNGGDLRCVLRALIVMDQSTSEQPAFEGAEIGTLASTSEPIRRLLTRITTLLCERLERSR